MATALTIGLAAIAVWLAGERRWRDAARARLLADLERGIVTGLYPTLRDGRSYPPRRG